MLHLGALLHVVLFSEMPGLEYLESSLLCMSLPVRMCQVSTGSAMEHNLLRLLLLKCRDKDASTANMAVDMLTQVTSNPLSLSPLVASDASDFSKPRCQAMLLK